MLAIISAESSSPLKGDHRSLQDTLNGRALESSAMPDIFERQPPDYSRRRVLQTLLSDCDDQYKSNDQSPTSGSPTLLSPVVSNSAVSESILTDVNTQMSLVEQSADLHLDDNAEQLSFWNVLSDDIDQGDGVIGGRKALKASRQSDASSTLNATMNSEEENRQSVFDAALASTATDFSFNMFGSDTPEVITFSGKERDDKSSAISLS